MEAEAKGAPTAQAPTETPPPAEEAETAGGRGQGAPPGPFAAACRRIADSARFQNFILVVIVANAITLGLSTYEHGGRIDSFLLTIEDVFLAIFVVEIAIRMLAYGRRPQDFFRSGWNVFDFTVVGLAFVPGLRGNSTLLRLARLARVVRLVSVMPDLRILVRALVRSLPPIASLVVLTVLLMYLYGMVGWILFADDDPEHWGNIGEALLSLFQILTLENWPAFLEAGQQAHPASWIYFVSYVLIASFLVINILIAIIINSMEEVHEAERAAERAELEAEVAAEGETVAQRLAEIRHALDELEVQLGARPAGGDGRRLSRPAKGGRARG